MFCFLYQITKVFETEQPKKLKKDEKVSTLQNVVYDTSARDRP